MYKASSHSYRSPQVGTFKLHLLCVFLQGVVTFNEAEHSHFELTNSLKKVYIIVVEYHIENSLTDHVRNNSTGTNIIEK